MSLDIGCERQVWQRRIAVFIRNTPKFGNTHPAPAMALPLTFRTITEADLNCAQEPTLSLSDDAAQQFMDELWRCGLRPTEGTGSAGSLAATERHLNDMRALVFKLQPK